MTRRLDIVNSYDSLIRSKKRTSEKSANTLLTYIILYSVIALVCIGMAIISMIEGPFASGFHWNKASLVVIFGLLYLFQLRSLLFEYSLLMHLKKLKKENVENTNVELDKELLGIIQKMNRSKKDVVFLSFAIVIAMFGLINLFSMEYNYWEYMQLPFILLVLYVIFTLLRDYLRLKKHLDKTEKLLIQ